ncbi:hypothetical protein [Novosphingobium sp. FKTRR1]|uniref:hypothetical protein n=1 Tax=Novosphingobium sp. FKTRR1 TaxID=2879118 RepID=UPI001CEFEC0A|nr:hypothetical protein [Novosphingobium sp. FKTRR1]
MIEPQQRDPQPDPCNQHAHQRHQGLPTTPRDSRRDPLTKRPIVLGRIKIVPRYQVATASCGNRA